MFFVLVFAANLMPAFTPPGWWIFGFYLLNNDADLPLLVVTGAAAAATGRFLLGHATRRLGARFLQARTLQNLAYVREAIETRRRNKILGLVLFLISPIPSAQLFEAAGLAGLRLLPLASVFFIGRTIVYSIYAYTAKSISQTSFGNMLRDQLTSPLGVAVQVGLLASLILLTRVNWRKHLKIEDKGEPNDRPHGR